MARWEKYKPTHAFLVALDISGFSKDLDPDSLLNHRMNFFNAITETYLFNKASEDGSVKTHFLGDELRLAYQVELGASQVKQFIDEVFSRLAQLNKRVREEYRTHVKGAVLQGVVTWKTWHNCDYINGELPFKAQRWMGYLAPGEVVADEEFLMALKTAGIPVSNVAQRTLASERGYLIKTS